MTDDRSTIIAKGLVKKFGDFTAVNGVDFQVAKGEIFGFLGPNGSGKTTTIRMMLGLIVPTQGFVEVLDLPVSENPGAIRSKVGYMSQRFSLYNDLTVEQNLRFYGRAYGLSNADLVKRMQIAVEMAGLIGREKVKTQALSGGWRQRLALSAAILHQPQVLFLDEPTAGVDPVSRREFWELLYQLVEQGVTVFVTTHYMDEAEHCHRLAFIQHGELIAMGTPDKLKSSMMKGRVIEIETSNTAQAIQVLREAEIAGNVPVSGIELYGSLVHALLLDDGAAVDTLEQLLKSSGLEPVSSRVIEPSLEDVFISCMREGRDKEL